MFSPHDFTVLASPQTAAWSCVRLGLVWTRSLRPRLPSARPRPPLSPFPRRVIRATWSNTANGASACAAPCVCTRRARPPPRRPDGGNAASPSAQESPAALVVATAPRPPARPCPASRICFACSQISEVDPSRSVCSVRGSFGAAASSAGTRLRRSFIS